MYANLFIRTQVGSYPVASYRLAGYSMDEQEQGALRQRRHETEPTNSAPEEKQENRMDEDGMLINNEHHSKVADSKEEQHEDKGLLPRILPPAIETKIERIVHWAWNSVSFDTLPHWLQDNEFLRNSHRPPMYSFRGCLKSLFRMHTETWNIWTHLLGFVFFLVLCTGVYIFGDYITWLFEDVAIHSLPWMEQLVLFMFFLGAMACLCCSFTFHLFSNHSHQMHYLFSRLDYSGIAFLITGSNIPAYYYGFYCTSVAQYIHIATVVMLGAACVCVSLWKKFCTPKYRPLRFAVFVLFGLYGVVPAAHILLRDGYLKASTAFALWGMILMGSLYIFGAGLYVLRIPERFSPGRFDIWASSHQLFHILVVGGALVHYDSLLTMVKYRLSAGGCLADLPIELVAV